MHSKRQTSARAPEGAGGACRDRRRRNDDGRRWVRPFFRASRALDASLRLIGSTLGAVRAARRIAHRRPVRASRDLHDAWALLFTASVRLRKAAENLTEMTACVEREPETTAEGIVVSTTERWLLMSSWLVETANEIFALHHSVLDGLETGALVPERPADARPRIVLIPRPVPVRAFLRLRRPRVGDRIATLLLRRRRTPRPAALRVPRRHRRGRAPPFFSVFPR